MRKPFICLCIYRIKLKWQIKKKAIWGIWGSPTSVMLLECWVISWWVDGFPMTAHGSKLKHPAASCESCEDGFFFFFFFLINNNNNWATLWLWPTSRSELDSSHGLASRFQPSHICPHPFKIRTGNVLTATDCFSCHQRHSLPVLFNSASSLRPYVQLESIQWALGKTNLCPW